MNLIIPVNLQAVRVTPNDASGLTKRSDLFSGPTTAFEALPWRDENGTEYPGRVTKANVSTNVNFPLAGGVTEQLDSGIHLHWALPEGLTHGVQQPDGSLVFPAVPNRWLVTRVLWLAGKLQVKQWVVESDRLMVESDFIKYFTATRRKCIAIPVGWNLLPDTSPEDGGAVYYSPSRRMGQVFELNVWQPAATPVGARLDQILHLDEFNVSANNLIAAGRTFEPLKAVGPNGPAFAAYYPDCRSVFGFHDTFTDLTGGFDLTNTSFQASYHVAGWHSHASDDPLQSSKFVAARTKAATANQNKPAADRLGDAQLFASVVQDTYQWCYDATVGTPARCVYAGQLSGLPWDTTGVNPNLNPTFPKSYLPPMDNDPSVRVAVGNSTSAALAALVKREWKDWTAANWTPEAGQAPAVPDQIEKDLEFLLDALQLGLLHRLGKTSSLAQLEQDLHQSGFGSRRGGSTWVIRLKPSASDKSDPSRFNAPDAVLPPDSDDAAVKLGALNAAQQRLNELLSVVESCQRQIFLDWYHYITTVYGNMDEGQKNTLKENLKNYIAEQILDLWAKLEAAFGKRTAASQATGNLPAFYSDASNYIGSKDGQYVTNSPKPSLAAQIVVNANDLVALLQTKYPKFELVGTEDARYWDPNEPVIVATGDSLTPARRNGIAKYLPCRLSGEWLGELKVTRAGHTSSLRAAEVLSLLPLALPDLAANQTPESRDTKPLLDDIKALMVEACLIDSALAPALATKLTLAEAAGLADKLRSAMLQLAGTIGRTWEEGTPAGARPPMPAVLKDQTVSADDLQATWPGQAPQGLALTYQTGAKWEDPFLPLFLVWTTDYTAFEKGLGAASDNYAATYLKQQFQLDENFIELGFGSSRPKPQAGATTVSGAIPLSSRASQPLLDQIRQYLDESPEENPQLQKVIDHLQDKPLLSQALNGIGPLMITRGVGLQMTPFDPFYDIEPTVGKLGAGTDSFDYNNVLTHFVGQTIGSQTDQVPLGDSGYSPLRAGYLDIRQLDVVDAFGRKRRVIDPSVPDDKKKIAVSWQLTAPGGVSGGHQAYLPPRLAQATRLRMRWLSAQDDTIATNSHPATSPVCGWIVPNHLDNSLMLFNPAGHPLGSLGVFGAQTTVTWQPAPGNPPRDIDIDLAGDNLRHLRKFADFIFGKDRDFFKALMDSIETAHTYILPADSQAAQAQAILMGRPLALLRAGLRLELAGLPAFDTSIARLAPLLSANANKTYDWTQRNTAGVLNVDFPVRLGDRNHLEDGLVAYLLDGPDPYKAIYAPAAAAAGTEGVVRPASDTLCLKLRANIDPPASAYTNTSDQIADLQNPASPSAQTIVTILMDPRGRVHASMGVLPVKAIDLPGEIYSQALRSIEVTFFTHPVLRGAQGLALPAPDEPGFLWSWTTSVKEQNSVHPQDEDLPAFQIGDRAHFSYSPQIAEDGWLKLKPQPKAKK